MSVVEALERELEALGSKAAESTLAATALALAREMDSPKNGGTSKSMIAGQLTDTMGALLALMPAKPEDDEIERARKRRADRLAGTAAAGAPSPS
jgi:hypothetical protein